MSQPINFRKTLFATAMILAGTLAGCSSSPGLLKGEADVPVELGQEQPASLIGVVAYPPGSEKAKGEELRKYQALPVKLIDTNGAVFAEMTQESFGVSAKERRFFRGITPQGEQLYVDAVNKTKIANPKLPYAGYFSEGLAPIVERERCGYGDASGNVKIPYSFATCGPFQDGFAIVSESGYANGGEGVINSSGELVVKIRNVKVRRISAGRFLQWGANGCLFIDAPKKSKVDLKIFPRSIQANRWGALINAGREGLYIPAGKDPIPVSGARDLVGPNLVYFLHQPPVVVLEEAPGKEKWRHPGLTIQDSGPEGLMVRNEQGLFGIVDTSNKIVAPVTYDNAARFEYGWTSMKHGDNMDVVESNGRVVLTLPGGLVTQYGRFLEAFTPGPTLTIWNRKGKEIFRTPAPLGF